MISLNEELSLGKNKFYIFINSCYESKSICEKDLQ